VPIAYGPGRLREIASFCRSVGMSRPLVVTDRNSVDLPFQATLKACLEDACISYSIYSNISPNPRDHEIMAGREHYRANHHDGVIAIGGGSGMDGGKAISLIANNDLDLWAFEYEQAPPDLAAHGAFPPLICIPTTAGTGAETESTTMVTDTARMMKWCIWHEKLKPSFAVLDPEITVGLPATMTAWTGVDALVHAIEAYSVPGFHPLCDGIALEAMRLVGKWLPAAVAEPENLEARGPMLAGSCLAGISFLKGLGLVHAVSHMIGAEYDTQHGLTNAVLLPAVLQYNSPALTEKIGPMCQALDVPDASFDALYNRVCTLLDEVSIPVNLIDIGVPADCASGIAAKALQDSAVGTNPRVPTLAEVQAVIELSLTNGRPAPLA
jgi:alcohol dehydrogenase class IV